MEDNADAPNAGGDPRPERHDQPRLKSPGEDTWTITADVLIRHHITPRIKLFVPTEANCPLPLKYIDVLRKTTTDIDEAAEAQIDDFWYDSDPKELSTSWTGRTVFTLLRPAPPDGYKWVEGRLTRLQTTTRPDSVWPEVWKSMSRKQQKTEIKNWKKNLC